MALALPVRRTELPRASGARALSEHKAKTFTRYHLRNGSQYLHWSGAFLTDRAEHAWSGYETQAKACQRTFLAAAQCKMVEV